MFNRLKEGDVLSYDPGVTHTEYDKFLPEWLKCRDAIAGAKAVKDAGPIYLPPLSTKQSPVEYTNYKNSAAWYGATGATLDMYTGMVMRKVPTIQINGESPSEDQQYFFATVTTEGQSFNWLSMSILNEVFSVNRVGILEDFTVEAGLDGEGNPVQNMSQLEYEQQDKKALSSIYRAESIINWRSARINGIETPVLWVLKEAVDYPDPDNPFDTLSTYNYRVLHLEAVCADVEMKEGEGIKEYEGRNQTAKDNGEAPVLEWRYRQILIVPVLDEVKRARKTKSMESKGGYWRVESVIYPQKDGAYLSRIPFYCITQNGVEADVRTPILHDMVEMNMAHYRNSADHEHELHMVSIKTAIFPGWDTETYGDPMLGQALASPPDQKPFILEATSVSKLLEAMKAKEERMAALGAQMLANQGRYAQTATTAEIASAGESSIIAQVSSNVSSALSEIMTFKAGWTNPGDPVEVDVSLNSDFYEERVTSEELSAWIKALQAGSISSQVFFYNMQRMEAYPKDWTYDEEMEAIDEDLSGGTETASELAILNERIAMLEGTANADSLPDDEVVDDEEDDVVIED